MFSFLANKAITQYQICLARAFFATLCALACSNFVRLRSGTGVILGVGRDEMRIFEICEICSRLQISNNMSKEENLVCLSQREGTLRGMSARSCG